MIGREVQLAPPGIIRAGDSDFESDSDPLLDIQVAKGGAGGFEAEDEEDGGLLPCCRICLESDSASGL